MGRRRGESQKGVLQSNRRRGENSYKRLTVAELIEERKMATETKRRKS